MPTSSSLQAALTSVPITSHAPFPLGPLCLPASPPPSSFLASQSCLPPTGLVPGCRSKRLVQPSCPFPRKVAAELRTTDKTFGPLARKPSHPPPPAKRAIQDHASHTPASIRAPCFNHEFSFFSWYSSEIGRVSDLTRVNIWYGWHLHPLKLST